MPRDPRDRPEPSDVELGATEMAPADAPIGVAETLTDPSAASAGGRAAARPERFERGDTADRYVILERLGAGGMGEVYAAYDPELDRKIALKLVKADPSGSTGGSAGRARLMREAQAMARLQHPNVIAVHDVGALGDEVFVAMELVEGRPLSSWLREHRGASRKELLGLFVQAGRGLAAAHAAGLIHRDFKPDNVIVGDDGRVRVLDFGLARPQGATNASEPATAAPITESGSQLDTPLTQTGAVMGTPAYMAPEQHLGEAVDARTDQFAFCVALYEALYGERPFAGTSYADIATHVLAGDIRAAPADARVPPWLRRALLRGLARAPAERFDSMDALLAELSRDPGRARRLWLAAAAIALVAAGGAFAATKLAGGAIDPCGDVDRPLATVWNEPRRASIRDALLETKLPYAGAVWDSVEKQLDSYARAWAAERRSACEATRVRGEQSDELMDLRMQCLAARLQDLDAVADVLASGGNTVAEHAVGAVERLPALATCANGEALRARAPLPADPAALDRIETTRETIARADALIGAARFEDAAPLVERLAAVDVGYAPVEAEARLTAAGYYESSGKFDRAAELLRAALERANAGRDEQLAARAALALSFLVGYTQSRPDQGHAWADLAESLLRSTGAGKQQWATLYGNRGAIYAAEGKYAESIESHRKSIALHAEIEEDDVDEARALDNLGAIYFAQDRFDEALPMHQRALELKLAHLGEEHPSVAATIDLLGLTYTSTGDRDRALELLERALAIRVASLGDGHREVALSLDNLGRAYRRLGRLDDALASHTRAVAAWRAAVGAKHPDVGISLLNITYTQTALGNYREAVDAGVEALGIFENSIGRDHPYGAYALAAIANAYYNGAVYDRAIRALDDLLALQAARRIPPTMVAENEFLLAQALRHSGRERTRANELARRARQTYESAGATSEVAAIDEWLAAGR